MPTVATSPTYSVQGRETRVTFTLTGVGSNFVRVWCTIAPEGSKFASLLATSRHHRTLVHEGDGGASAPWRWTPDKGGKYTFIAQEYARGTGYGGSYQGDPSGQPTETPVGTEATLVVYIGQRMTQKIGTGQNVADLVLYVWDTTVQATTLELHGEKTPAIVATRPTPIVATAMRSNGVTTALDALAGETVTTAVGTLATVVSNIRTKYEAHRASGTFHASADSDNAIKPEFASSPSASTLPRAVNEILRMLRQHMTNDDGGGVGVKSYHQTTGTNRADFLNLAIVPSVSGLSDAYAAIADIWRAYEAHRASTAVHASADSTNTLTALPKLLELHRQFLIVLAALSPTVPPAQTTAAVTLIATAGFTET